MSELKVLPIEAIEEAGFSLREAQLKDPKFLELLESVKAHGVYEPILVRKFKNPVTGKEGYQLVNGCQRLTAAKQAGRKDIPCNIMDMSNDEMMIAQITTNSAKIETKPGQYATMVKNLLNQPNMAGVSLAYVAKLLHMTVEQLARIMSLNKLSDDVKTLIDEGKLTLANAVSLSMLPPDVQPEMLQEACSAKAEEFKMACAERKNAIVAEKRGNGTQVPVYQHRPKFRDYALLESELANGTDAKTILKDVKDVAAAFKLGIQYAVSSTPMDVANGKAKWEADRKAAEEKRAAAKAEREAAKAKANAAEATK